MLTKYISHYLSVKVAHLFQRHVGPLIHFDDFFVRDNTEASGKRQEAQFKSPIGERNDCHTSGNCWGFSSKV